MDLRDRLVCVVLTGVIVLLVLALVDSRMAPHYLDPDTGKREFGLREEERSFT